jgi:hypothetical protein
LENLTEYRVKKNKTTQTGGFYSPSKQLKLPELSRQFPALMDEEGVTLAELLARLAEERKAIYQEKYGNAGLSF